MAKSTKAPADSQPAASKGEAERFDPARDGPDLAYEHTHRYAAAAQLVAGLRVLDLASGTGYGSALLARSAAWLLRVDLDRSTLGGAGSPGCCADAQALPIADASFDAVVCFEAIEHVPNPRALLDEVQRVLRGPALFIASTPERGVYTDRAGHRNPHHCSEMTRAEFLELLQKRFRHVQLYGQSLWAGSWLSRLEENERCAGTGPRSPVALEDPLAKGSSSRVAASWADPGESEFPVPLYLVAACANSEVGEQMLEARLPLESVLHDPGQWLLGRYERSLDDAIRARADIETARSSIGELEEQLRSARVASSDQDQQIARARERVDSLVADIEIARSAATSQERDIAAARGAIAELEAQIEEAVANAVDSDEQMAQARSTIAELEAQIEEAVANAANSEEQMAQARSTIAELEAEIQDAVANAASSEQRMAQARSTIAELEAQIRDAVANAANSEEQMAQARSTIAELEAQIRDAVANAANSEEQMTQARSTIAELEAQIRDAVANAADFEGQIEMARARARVQEEEIESARRALSERDRQLAATRENVQRLEAQLARRLHRFASKLSDLLDRLRGRRS